MMSPGRQSNSQNTRSLLPALFCSGRKRWGTVHVKLPPRSWNISMKGIIIHSLKIRNQPTFWERSWSLLAYIEISHDNCYHGSAGVSRNHHRHGYIDFLPVSISASHQWERMGGIWFTWFIGDRCSRFMPSCSFVFNGNSKKKQKIHTRQDLVHKQI